MPVRLNSRAMKPISSEKLSPARFDASGAEEEKSRTAKCDRASMRHPALQTSRQSRHQQRKPLTRFFFIILYLQEHRTGLRNKNLGDRHGEIHLGSKIVIDIAERSAGSFCDIGKAGGVITLMSEQLCRRRDDRRPIFLTAFHLPMNICRSAS